VKKISSQLLVQFPLIYSSVISALVKLCSFSYKAIYKKSVCNFKALHGQTWSPRIFISISLQYPARHSSALCKMKLVIYSICITHNTIQYIPSVIISLTGRAQIRPSTKQASVASTLTKSLSKIGLPLPCQ